MAVLPKVVHTSCANVGRTQLLSDLTSTAACSDFASWIRLWVRQRKVLGCLLCWAQGFPRADKSSWEEWQRDRQKRVTPSRLAICGSVDHGEAGNTIFASCSCPRMQWRAWVNVSGLYSGLHINITYSLYSLYTACVPASICSACRQLI